MEPSTRYAGGRAPVMNARHRGALGIFELSTPRVKEIEDDAMITPGSVKSMITLDTLRSR